VANKSIIALEKLDDEARKVLASAAEHVIEAKDGSGEKNPEYYARKAYSDNTYRSYRSDFQDFAEWAGVEKPIPVTTAVVVQYLSDRAEILAPTTLQHRVAALSFIHRLLGYDDPTKSGAVTAVLRGIRKDRKDNGWKEDQAPAFTVGQFTNMIELMGASIHDMRDKAFLLVGLFGAFRQGELTGLTVERLKEIEGLGYAVEMGIVKQDQVASKKVNKPLPLLPNSKMCPVTALKAYMDEAGIDAGPVFRGINRYGRVGEKAMSHPTANRIVQKWAKRALIPNGDEYSVHSLRASFVTVLRGLGVSDALIARQTDHRNLATMQIYDRPENAFDDSPVAWLAEAFQT